LWDSVSYQQAVTLILESIETTATNSSNNSVKNEITAQKLSERLVHTAVAKNSLDNITVIVIKLT
jgi:serine/threonine protein phosphatase PrpC